MTTRVEDWSDEDVVRFLAVEGMGYCLHDFPKASEQSVKGWECRRCGLTVACYPGQGTFGPFLRGWNPLTDANDLFGKDMLVEAMRGEGHRHELATSRYGHKSLFRIIGDANDPGSSWFDKNIKRAVCLACAKALLAMKESE